MKLRSLFDSMFKAFQEPGAMSAQAALPSTYAATLEAILDSGVLVVRSDSGQRRECLWLDRGAGQGPDLCAGDRVLVTSDPRPGQGVVLGRITPYAPARPAPRLVLEATEALTLRCGEASVELRADGRAMVKGEDVLLRAKGTQRIRAGNVAIN